jgi:GDP-L-fucose synthase
VLAVHLRHGYQDAVAPTHSECDLTRPGGTGQPSRRFLHVRDCAQGIVAALERYDGAEPVNLGGGEEIRIGDLVQPVAQATVLTGAIRFDPSFPDGQPRRKLDASRALASFGWGATTDRPAGPRATVDWYHASNASDVEAYTAAPA